MRDNLTLEGGFRYVYWPPWYAKLNNIAMFHPDFYDPARAAVIDPSDGCDRRRRPLQRHRAAGRRLPLGSPGRDRGRGQPRVPAPVPSACPRGFSETHSTVFEPRLGFAYRINPKTIFRLGGGIYHTRITLNDSTLLGGNPPIQFKVGVTQRRRRPARGRHAPGLPARDDHAGPRVQAPDRLQLERLVPARAAVRRRRRRDLRGPHGRAPAARAQHQPAPAGDAPGQPWRQRERAAALPGLRHDPALGELGPLDLPRPAGATSSGASAAAWASASPTRSRACATTPTTSATSCSTRSTTAGTGAPRTTTAPTCSTSTTSTSCRSGATRTRRSRRSWAAGRSRA